MIQHDTAYLSAFWQQFTPPAGLIETEPGAGRYRDTVNMNGIDAYYLDRASWLALLAAFVECYSDGYEMKV